MSHPIITCARSYLGTRFHHQGRLKKTAHSKGGIDCLGLLAGVAAELQLRGKNGEMLALFDRSDYSHQPDTAELRRRLDRLLIAIPHEQMRAGDIALFEIDGMAQHMGIITDYAGGTGLIHAYAPARAVVEHALDACWRDKIAGLYRLQNS